MRYHILIFLALTVGILSCSQFGPHSPRSIQKNAQEDLDFLKDYIKKNHPAGLNGKDKHFHDWLDKGYKSAKKMASIVQSKAEHFQVLDAYIKGFDQPHLSVKNDDFFQPEYSWAGFHILLSGSGSYVMSNADYLIQYLRKRLPKEQLQKLESEFTWQSKNLPPAGAKLLSCDGLSVDEIIAKKRFPIGKQKKDDLATEIRAAQTLFSYSNTSLWEKPKNCKFSHEKKNFSIDLAWPKISQDFYAFILYSSTLGHQNNGFALHQFGKNSHWVTLPTFQVDQGRGQKLVQMLEKAKKSGIKKSKNIVFDLRGNIGGSTQYFDKILETVLSKKTIKTINKCYYDNYEIYRRASQDNLDYIRKKSQEKNSLQSYYQDVMLPKYEKAYKNGEPSFGVDLKKINRPMKPWANDNDLTKGYCKKLGKKAKGRPRFVAFFDASCASACVMFLDYLAQFGDSVFLGQPSHYRDLYLETFYKKLPNGKMTLGYPSMFQRNPNLRSRYHPRMWFNSTSGTVKDLQGRTKKVLETEFNFRNI